MLLPGNEKFRLAVPLGALVPEVCINETWFPTIDSPVTGKSNVVVCNETPVNTLKARPGNETPIGVVAISVRQTALQDDKL